MRIRWATRLLAAVSLGLTAVVAIPARPAQGATFTVSSTADSGPGSLRQAITDAGSAAGADTVVIPAGLGTITLSSTIQFSGTALTTVDGNGNTVSYAAGTAFNAAGTTPYALTDLRIVASQGANTLDGALTITDATLEVTSQAANTLDGALTITSSSIESDDDGANTRGGLLAVSDTSITFGAGTGLNTLSSPITVADSTITSTSDGDGINTSTGDITVTDSEVATGGAGINSSGSQVSVQRSSVIGTDGSDDGVVSSRGSVELVNSTVTGWQSDGIYATDVTLVYATVVENGDDEGAGILAEGLTSFGSVVTTTGIDDCFVAETTSHGYNFSNDDSCGFTATGDTQNGPDPVLGALGANGGTGRTLVPGTGSDLLDAIPTAACQDDGATGVTTDERGLPRPAGPGCDIGAVEVQTPTASTTTTTTVSTTSTTTSTTEPTATTSTTTSTPPPTTAASPQAQVPRFTG
jgi:hypothetical protein